MFLFFALALLAVVLISTTVIVTINQVNTKLKLSITFIDTKPEES